MIGGMFTKLLAGALGVVTLVCIFLWLDGQAAKDRAATAEAAFTTQKAEAEQANRQLTEVVDEYGKREDEFQAKAEQAAEYRRRALFAEREHRLLAASGDVAALNRRVCEILDGIEGGNSEDREARCRAAGSAGDGAGKVYRIAEADVASLLTNLERIRSFVDQVDTPSD